MMPPRQRTASWVAVLATLAILGVVVDRAASAWGVPAVVGLGCLLMLGWVLGAAYEGARHGGSLDLYNECASLEHEVSRLTAENVHLRRVIDAGIAVGS